VGKDRGICARLNTQHHSCACLHDDGALTGHLCSHRQCRACQSAAHASAWLQYMSLTRAGRSRAGRRDYGPQHWVNRGPRSMYVQCMCERPAHAPGAPRTCTTIEGGCDGARYRAGARARCAMRSGTRTTAPLPSCWAWCCRRRCALSGLGPRASAFRHWCQRGRPAAHARRACGVSAEACASTCLSRNTGVASSREMATGRRAGGRAPGKAEPLTLSSVSGCCSAVPGEQGRVGKRQ